MALLNSYKTLKASSLLESVIAITIISICLLIAIQIYSSVFSNSSSVLYLNLKIAEHEIISNTKLNSSFNDEIFNYKTYSIEKKVSEYIGDPKLLLVNLKGIIEKDTISNHNYLITNSNNYE